MTCDVIGKHLQEFEREEKNSVPYIFIALISYFEASPELMETEGLFRVVCSQTQLDELQVHLSMGNYY